MKRFTRSILFYPFLVLVLSTVTMTFFYFYLLEKEKSVYIDSTLKEARDDLYLLKNSIETYSLQKNPDQIQGEIQRIAVRSNVESIFIFCPKEKLHYSSRKSDIGKPFSALFSSTQIAHYREELHARKAPHIHLENSGYRIDATIPLNYLYLPNKGVVKTGSLIVRYDITYDIRQLTQQLQHEMLLFFSTMILIIVVLIFGFYRHFVTKFYHLAESTAQLAGTPVQKRMSKALVSIDDLLEQERQAVRRLAILSFIFEKNPDSIIVTTADKKIITVNESFERLFGMREAEVLGKKPEESFSSRLMPKEHYRQMWKTLLGQGVWTGEIIDRRQDGTALSLWQSLFTFEEPLSKARYFVGISRDISDEIDKREEIRRLAFSDLLTGLANRIQLMQTVAHFIAVYQRERVPFALLFIDLDDFKEINDTLGHECGDMLLRAFTLRLKKVLRTEDIAARFGGDEFVVLAPGIMNPVGAMEIACRITAVLEEPFSILDDSRRISASIGIALFPQDGENAEKLLSAADIAMYRSKEAGKNRCTLFEQTMQLQTMEKIQLRHELEHAITQNQLELYLQPKISATDRSIHRCEALIRWHHPTRGMVPPYLFIPIAEESHLIITLTQWIFKEVDRLQQRLVAAGFDAITIAVNISSRHFATMHLIDELRDNITPAYLAQGKIDIEVTESAVMDDIESATRQLEELHAVGMHVALDDFGTGHSSLAYLKHLPIDLIKIDKSFIDGICSDAADRAIVKNTINLAKSLKIKSVAEGVETAEQAELLTSMGVDFLQGYYFAKPMPFDAFLEILKEQHTKG